MPMRTIVLAVENHGQFWMSFPFWSNVKRRGKTTVHTLLVPGCHRQLLYTSFYKSLDYHSVKRKLQSASLVSELAVTFTRHSKRSRKTNHDLTCQGYRMAVLIAYPLTMTFYHSSFAQPVSNQVFHSFILRVRS